MSAHRSSAVGQELRLAHELPELGTRPTLLHFWSPTVSRSLTDLPILRRLWGQYHPLGLAMIGVHSPMFNFERDPAYMTREQRRLGIHWSTIHDTDDTLADQLGHTAWPHIALLNADGTVVTQQFGRPTVTLEQAVQQQLAIHGRHPLTHDLLLTADESRAHVCHPHLPDAHFGYERSLYQSSPADAPPTTSGQLSLTGEWLVNRDAAQARTIGRDHAATMVVTGATIGAVLGDTNAESRVEVTVNGVPVPQQVAGRDLEIDESGLSYLRVTHPRYYELIASTRSLPPVALRLTPTATSTSFYCITTLTCTH